LKKIVHEAQTVVFHDEGFDHRRVSLVSSKSRVIQDACLRNVAGKTLARRLPDARSA
jgi:hypothetical protein